MDDHFFTKEIVKAAKALTVLAMTAVIFCCSVCAAGAYEAYADEKDKDKDKDSVSFTVYHQDTEGNELADPQVFYGKVGDKPLISSVDVEGYVPQVDKITRTISENTEENVFTFVYDAEGLFGEEKSDEVKVLDIDETKTPLADPGKPQAGMKESGNGLTLMLAFTCLAVLAVFGIWRRKKKSESERM